MPKRLGKFELPNKLTKVEEGSTPTYAKFIAEPFEAGYGHTIGNSLRRVLLSSIEGSAISSIKIEGVQHEFQSIDGVVEDVTDIVLNLKSLVAKVHSDATEVEAPLVFTGPGDVKAKDIDLPAGVEILNPDVHIVASAREHENAPLMKQSGANSVITSSDAVGRLLGLSSLSPTLGAVMEDLLSYGEGLEVAERDLLVSEVGKQPQSLPDQVIAVVRDEKVYRYFDPVVTLLARGDRLVVVRPAKELPWAPRPGTHNEALASDLDD